MNCAEIRPNLGAFVLGGLEPEEDVETRRHLASCSSCRTELEELEEINQVLKAAPLPADPPRYFKGEILSRVRAEESVSSYEASSSANSFRFALPVVAAAALVAIVALGVFFGSRAETPAVTVQLIATPGVNAEGEEYWGVAELYPQPSGSQLVELKLNNLKEPGADNFYEMWFVSGEKHISAGAFTTTGLGETRVWLTAPAEARNYPTLLVTEEPADNGSHDSKEEILKGEVG